MNPTFDTHPARLTIDYPDRQMDRMSTLLRALYALPILLIVALIDDAASSGAIAGAMLGLPALLLILFRQKYPRWWFDFNLQLARFTTRVVVYLALMSDAYPSTDEEQSVHLELDYPDVRQDLNRWLPLVKWLLAVPHYVALFFLAIAASAAVVFAWFSLIFTGRYPPRAFAFVEGVLRWALRVEAYALLLVTDRYPPFSLN